MANIPISNISMEISPPTTPTTPSIQTPLPEAGTIVRIHGVASSIRPSGEPSFVGRVIPVPSQVSATSSATKEEEKEFIHFFQRTLDTGSRVSGEVDKGLLKNGLPKAQGNLSYVEGEGEFQDGKFHGRGVYSSSSGTIYNGYFKDGKCHGEGILNYINGIIYAGEFRDGKFYGKGKLTYSEKEYYDGQFKNGKFDGQGIYSFSDGKVYVGQFKDGKCHGPGTITYPNGDVYVGNFQDGKSHGKGKLTKTNGKVYNGRFENDQFTQGCCIQ